MILKEKINENSKLIKKSLCSKILGEKKINFKKKN